MLPSAHLSKPVPRARWYLIFHLVAWLLFLLASIGPTIIRKVALSRLEGKDPTFFAPPPIELISGEGFFTLEIVNFFVMMGLFYSQANWAIPKFLQNENRNKRIQYAFITVGSVLLNTMVLLLVMQYFPELDFATRNVSVFGPILLIRHTISIVMVLALSTATSFSRAWGEQRQQSMDIANQQLESELALLKAQLSPHFLFNTLNNLRSLIRKGSADSEDVVLRLSELLRYVVYDSEASLIGLDKELDYISNLVSLQQLRLPPEARISLASMPEASRWLLPPMLLVPLVENVFKHGADSTIPLESTMEILLDGNWFTFRVWNAASGQSSNLPGQQGGVGLLNLKRRLELHFKDNYELRTEMRSDGYVAEVSFPLVDLFASAQQATSHPANASFRPHNLLDQIPSTPT
jgi:LytS/YehU family sensor histidine kinase